MGDSVTHAPDVPPGYERIKADDFDVLIHQPRRRFTDDDEADDDRLLRSFVLEKIFLAKPFDKGAGVRGSLAHMSEQIVRRPHTGRASRRI
jgi:hypothetical protein